MKLSTLFARGSALVLGSLWPAIVMACPVCGGGGGDSPRSQLAFFNTTILLSLLPPGMIVGGVLWLRHDARDFLSSEFEDRDDPRAAEERKAPDLELVDPKE